MENLSGKEIKTYLLQELIGVGGFGAVYRAHQALVNREVAVKLILPEYANQPEFIRRFQYEAQLVARLEHIHIVPLYDYWREPDSAYLVMRLLRGGSLKTVLHQGAIPLSGAIQLVSQIASALMVAHRNGVIHQDVKPANILLDEDGNAYLSDFGIAELLAGRDGFQGGKSSYGTPAYMAPERLMREPVTPQSDIYSLGIILFEMITGQHPFADTFTEPTMTTLMQKHLHEPLPPLNMEHPALSDDLNTIIQMATAKDPHFRYRDVLSFAADLNKIIVPERGTLPQPLSGDVQVGSGDTLAFGGSETKNFAEVVPGGLATKAFDTLTFTEEELVPENPYKGLRVFTEADAADFFGRDALLEQLLERFAETENGRFLAVVGPSGSGKSSVVRASLIPALRQGKIAHSDQWFIAKMVPGIHPLADLEAALLSIAQDDSLNLTEQLTQDEYGLVSIVQDALPDDESELLLVIDQFEELFTLVEDTDERDLFIESLTLALRSPECRLRVILTLRADFYDRPLLYPDFGDLVRRHTEVVLPLSAEELEQAIIRPALRVGLTPEPGLVPAIIADVESQPGALPLLQYALTELYERRDDSMLTLEAYRVMGGAAGALARRADDLFNEQDEIGQIVIRQLFLRLFNLDEAAQDTRRRVRRSELTSLDVDRETMEAIIDIYGQYRLLTFDRDPGTREQTIEVAHEALMRMWGRLQEWIQTSREDLHLHRRLAAAANEWKNGGRDASFLARGSQLAQFETLAVSQDIALNAQEIAYVEASIALRQRSVNRLRVFVGSLILLTLVAAGMAVFALDRQQQAETQSQVSRSRELAANAMINVDRQDFDVALLLSLESLRIFDTFEAHNALLTALQSQVGVNKFFHGHTDAVRAVAFDPTGRVVVSGGRGTQIRLWDTFTGQAIGQPLKGHTDWINGLAFSPDGLVLASGSADNTVRLWDMRDLNNPQPINAPLTGHTDHVWDVAFSPDGGRLVSASADGTLRMWDMTTGQPIGEPLVGHGDMVFAVAFSPDGQFVASGSADNTVRLWNAITGEAVGQPLEGHTNWILTLAFSPNGDLLASSGADQTVILWDVITGEKVLNWQTEHTDWIRDLAFSPDGKWLVSASEDDTLQVWDVLSGRRVGQPLVAHTGDVWSVAFHPDGQLAVSGGEDNQVILWDVTQQSHLLKRKLAGHEESVEDLAFSPDGSLLASVSGNPLEDSVDNSIRFWDVETGEELAQLTQQTQMLTSLAFSPDGKWLATGSLDRTIVLWDVKTATAQTEALIGHEGGVSSVVFGSNSTLLVSGDAIGQIILWNVDADMDAVQRMGDPLVGHTDSILTLAISPNGKWLASAGHDKTIVLWDIGDPANPHQLGEPLTAHTDSVTHVAFSADSQMLVSASRDKSIRLWDISNPSSPQILGQPLTGHQNWVLDVAFSPSEQLLASGSRDTSVMLWDSVTGRALGLPLAGHRDWSNAVAFSPDGRTLASGGRDGAIILWDVDLESWRALACQIANRDFTAQERDRFSLGNDAPPICPS